MNIGVSEELPGIRAVTQKAQFQWKRVALGAVAGGAVAAAVNTGLYLLFHALGVAFMIQPDPAAPAAPISAPSFGVASFVAALLAGGLLLLLGRFTTKARRAFVVIACAITALSLAGPATIGGASSGTRVALMLIHLVAAMSISRALLLSTRTQDDTMPATVGR